MKTAVRELPLNSLWESFGATIKTEQDWRIPSIFRDFLYEYTAIHKGVGILDQSFRGKIEITGQDRISFLHHVLTNDIQSLGLGTGCYAALLSATGKVLADMDVFVFANSVLLSCEMGLEKKLMDHLNKLIVSENVQLADVTEHFALISLQGPRAEALAQALFPGPFPEFAEFQHANCDLGDANVTLIRRSRIGKIGFHLLTPKENAAQVAERTLVVGKLYGLRPVGFGAVEIVRIEAGVLRYGVDMDESVTLPETGLDAIAASETKGCYPGQEVVARTKTYGGPAKKMAGLIFAKGPLPAKGDKIYSEDKEIGWVTSACVSPALDKGIALGYISKSASANLDELEIRKSSEKIKASLRSLPFARL